MGTDRQRQCGGELLLSYLVLIQIHRQDDQVIFPLAPQDDIEPARLLVHEDPFESPGGHPIAQLPRAGDLAGPLHQPAVGGDAQQAVSLGDDRLARVDLARQEQRKRLGRENQRQGRIQVRLQQRRRGARPRRGRQDSIQRQPRLAQHLAGR